MGDLAQYVPGPVGGAEIRKDGELWTLVLTRDLRHPPELVWEALTDSAQLREWAPFEVDGNLDSVGARVKVTWVGTGHVSETTVTRAESPRVLEYYNIRWELEPRGKGTRLTLWHSIDRRFIAWGAAGWHIAFDVLDRLLAGTPIGRMVRDDAMKLAAWQQLVGAYAEQLGVETPKMPGKPT